MTARPPLRPRAIALLCLVCLVALAGCGDKPTTRIEVNGEVIEVEEPVDPGNGIVAGIVGDDAIYPLEGAVVRIIGMDLSDTTDSGGQFVIVDVPPGIYILEGSKKDHKPVQTTVDVQPGKVASAALLLERVPPTDPYHITFQHRGSAQYTGPFLSLPQNLTFPFEIDPSQPVTLVLESKWSATFVTAGARPPLRYRIEDPAFREVVAGEAAKEFVVHLDARVLTPGHSRFTVRIEPNDPDPYVTLQATSQDFMTVFYNAPAPADWSILAGSV